MSVPHFFIDGTDAALLLSACTQSQDAASLSEDDGELSRQNLELRLPKETISHMHTLRLRAGERIVLVDAPGHGWEFELTAPPDKKTQILEGRALREHQGAPSVDLTLVQSISATERMDQTIRQVTELGVSRIVPLESERSTVRLTDASRQTKRERWKRIARGAAEQSGQLSVPHIDLPTNLTSTLEALKDHDVLLFFWEEEGGLSVTDALVSQMEVGWRRAGQRGVRLREKDCHCGLEPQSRGRVAGSLRELHDDLQVDASQNSPFTQSDGALASRLKVALFIGPEGGFSEREAAALQSSGARTVTLGDTILRTETAAVVACALVLYQLGALGGS